MINGQFAGRGATTVQVKRDSAVSVQVTADNCETMYRSIGHHMSGLGVLDIVGGVFLLVPFFGLAAAGSRNLDEESIHFTLPCKDPETGEIIQHEAIEIKEKEVEKVEELEEVEEAEDVERVAAIEETSFKSSEAIVISTGTSKPVSSSPLEWSEAIVTVSAEMGQGSGFVISENLILTNHHIVGESKSVAIIFSNGLQLIGKVIASNPSIDVAAVEVDFTLPKYFHLSKTTPTLGADVYSIGTPLNQKLHIAISQGTINALRIVKNQTLIQSNINIPSGNSGGPLLDKSGAVVGIAVSKYSANKTSQSISFFIPIDDALKSLEGI